MSAKLPAALHRRLAHACRHQSETLPALQKLSDSLPGAGSNRKEKHMTQQERLDFLIRWLLAESAEYGEITVPDAQADRRQLLRALMNVRPPRPASDEFLCVQDEYLQELLAERGAVRIADLAPVEPDICLWKGDITTLAADAIVNAANSRLLGCFAPCHGCIDNAIHTYAGVQLRLECARIMAAQKNEEPAGRAKITRAYNLPCRHVLHTVGPIVHGSVTPQNRAELAGCYRSCLELAAANGLKSVAFCCISTGEFHFPNQAAAEIAAETVRTWQREHHNTVRVIFNVFKETDYDIYRNILGVH